MRKDLDQKLCEDFSLLYKDRNGDPRQTCMVWGFPGDGWEPLIRRLSEKIEAAIRAMRVEDREHYYASQVKEKYGTLRFYMDASTFEMNGWIDEAEAESAVTCETCGEPGSLRGTGWLRTACEAHATWSPPDHADD